MATALVPPPADKPELGATRLLAVEWESPERLDAVKPYIAQASESDSPLARALGQMGLRLSMRVFPEADGAFEMGIGQPDAGGSGSSYADILLSFRQSGPWTVFAYGANRSDAGEKRLLASHRGDLAAMAAEKSGPGGPDIREAFTRMARRGADWLGLLDPVRFLQLAFTDSADWRERLPDRIEPESTRLAREMLEYRSGGAWTAVGEYDGRGRHVVNGSFPWNSLTRLAGALGVTEAIGMD